MDKSVMKTTPVILLILIGASIAFVTYFNFFHGAVSTNSQDWASFGNYISGVLMPLLTAINIWVFVKLTQTINQSQTEFQKNESYRQDERHKSELEQQRRLIITQMRQAEINQLSKTLDRSFIPESSSCSDMQAMRLSTKNNLNKSIIEIDSFLNEKQNLFPLNHNSSAYIALIDVNRMIGEIQDQFDNPDFEVKLVELMKLKHKAIQALYQFTTDNIAN
jgi:large-conductance mechanosensitive channel